MHIVYIDPHAVPDTCPEAMQILQTVDGMAQTGISITLVTPPVRTRTVAEDILGRPLHPGVRLLPLDDLRDRWWYPARSGKHFYRQARRLVSGLKGVDGLLVRNLKLAEALLSVKNRPPMVFETHEIFARTFAEERPHPFWKERRKLAALRRREHAIYAGSEGVAALTQWLVDDLREEYGVNTPMRVVPDGVDLSAAENAVFSPSTDGGPARLLYLGSLHPWKGVNCLLDALPAIEQACLIIAGGPSQRIAELKAQAEMLGVAGRVVFMGEVPPARRFEVIAGADICMLPLTNTAIGSRYTSPLKLFEYMAMGKPVVAADVPALRSVIVSGENGILTPVDNPAQLAAAVNRLLQSPGQLKVLGEAARKSAQDYSWEARAHLLAGFFTELKGRR